MWPFRKKSGAADALIKSRGLFGGTMFKFIKTDEEWIQAEVDKVVAEIKTTFAAKKNEIKCHITLVWDDALHNIEMGLTEAGLQLDDEAEAALTVLKNKLSAFKDTIEPKAPVDSASPASA